MQQETKILRPGVLKTIVLLLVCALFVTIGILYMDENLFTSWMGILFFGLGAIVFVIQLIPNSSYLKLTIEGFEVKNLFRTTFTKWSEVELFTVGRVRRSLMVLYNYSIEHNKYNTAKKMVRSLAGNEAALPNNYGMKAIELAKLMNEWKLKEAKCNEF